MKTAGTLALETIPDRMVKCLKHTSSKVNAGFDQPQLGQIPAHEGQDRGPGRHLAGSGHPGYEPSAFAR
jgi:hypothetical protein